MTRPHIFDIEGDCLDRKLMDFAPEPIDLLPDEQSDDDPIDDQSLDDLLAEADDLLDIERELSGDDDGDEP